MEFQATPCPAGFMKHLLATEGNIRTQRGRRIWKATMPSNTEPAKSLQGHCRMLPCLLSF